MEKDLVVCNYTFKHNNLILPCGKCIMCRKAKANEYAKRLSSEVPYYKNGVFITLTYESIYKDVQYSLSKPDVQKFIKRLRKWHQNGRQNTHYNCLPLKYFCCGEYGTKNGRPHYHLIILGLSTTILTEDILKTIWNTGRVEVSYINLKRIYYTTGYLIKKQYSDNRIYTSQGIEPPFLLISKNMGLKHFIENKEKFLSDYLSDKPVIRYYLKHLQKLYPKETQRGELSKRLSEIRKFKKSKFYNIQEYRKAVLESTEMKETYTKAKEHMIRRDL